jgi:hypothetical protein
MNIKILGIGAIVVVALLLVGIVGWYYADRTLTGNWPTGVNPENASGYVIIDAQVAKQASSVAPPLVLMDAGTKGTYNNGIPAASVQSFQDWFGSLFSVTGDNATANFKVTIAIGEGTEWNTSYTLYPWNFQTDAKAINGIPNTVWSWESPMIFVHHGTVIVKVMAYEALGGTFEERMAKTFSVIC